MANSYVTAKDKDRAFWERVNKNGPVVRGLSPCWIWMGPTIVSGYGKAGTLGLSHRYSWEVHYGTIPNNLSVLHKCDCRVCVNPDHLFLGTQQDNLEDMRNKGHQVRGELQGGSKLTTDQVLEIRRRYKRYSHTNGSGALAREFGISSVQAYKIAKGAQWKHLI